MMIPGVRAAYGIAEEKRLEAARLQGEVLAMRSRIDALETERAATNQEKDAAYKLVVNIFSQYAWGVKQFPDGMGMPPQFHPKGGAMESDTVNASTLVAGRSAKAMDDFFREMEKVGSD
jgi:hypothetical protein